VLFGFLLTIGYYLRLLNVVVFSVSEKEKIGESPLYLLLPISILAMGVLSFDAFAPLILSYLISPTASVMGFDLTGYDITKYGYWTAIIAISFIVVSLFLFYYFHILTKRTHRGIRYNVFTGGENVDVHYVHVGYGSFFTSTGNLLRPMEIDTDKFFGAINRVFQSLFELVYAFERHLEREFNVWTIVGLALITLLLLVWR
jgi:heme/copper-type cytochrome/quinol oxidase subunit 4